MIPRLIHPQVITAYIPSKSRVEDDVFREPVGRSAINRTKITFRAQVNQRATGSMNNQKMEFNSLTGEAKMYLIARANSNAKLLTKGSKITAYNKVPCNLTVIRIDPHGFERGKYHLLCIWLGEDNT